MGTRCPSDTSCVTLALCYPFDFTSGKLKRGISVLHTVVSPRGYPLDPCWRLVMVSLDHGGWGNTVGLPRSGGLTV